MGISIDIHEYDYNKLVSDICEYAKKTTVENRVSGPLFCDSVLPHFGKRYGDKFIVLSNEYYEDYDASVELMKAVRKYYGLDDVWLGCYNFLDANNNADEVLSEVFGEDYE